MAGGDAVRISPGQTHQIGVSRAQDEAMVGYVFQRPIEQEYNAQSSAFQTKQTPRAWTLADDTIIDNVRSVYIFYHILESLNRPVTRVHFVFREIN